MALNISQSNLVGFPLIYEADIDTLTSTSLGAVYEGGDQFSVDINFINEPPPEIQYTIELVSSTSAMSDFSVVQKNDHVLTLSGRAFNLFTDAYYEFIMPDKTLKILRADTTEKYLSLVRWAPPSTKRTLVTHSVKYLEKSAGIPSVEATTIFTQEVFWRWSMAVQQFIVTLNKGAM